MYLQSYNGHRIIYALVFIDWALSNGYEIVVSSPDSRVVNELQQHNVQAIESLSNDHLNIFRPETGFTDTSLRIYSSHSSKSTYPIS